MIHMAIIFVALVIPRECIACDGVIAAIAPDFVSIGPAISAGPCRLRGDRRNRPINTGDRSRVHPGQLDRVVVYRASRLRFSRLSRHSRMRRGTRVL